MAPKRKGGGTKGFLKTAVRAGTEQGDAAAPQEATPAVPQADGDQSGAGAAAASDVGSTETPALAKAPAASVSALHAANGAAAAAHRSKPAPGAEPGEGGGGGGGGDETRGQMLQRHKKVPCVRALLAAGRTTAALRSDHGGESQNRPASAPCRRPKR